MFLSLEFEIHGYLSSALESIAEAHQVAPGGKALPECCCVELTPCPPELTRTAANKQPVVHSVNYWIVFSSF